MDVAVITTVWQTGCSTFISMPVSSVIGTQSPQNPSKKQVAVNHIIKCLQEWGAQHGGQVLSTG